MKIKESKYIGEIYVILFGIVFIVLGRAHFLSSDIGSAIVAVIGALLIVAGVIKLIISVIKDIRNKLASKNEK